MFYLFHAAAYRDVNIRSQDVGIEAMGAQDTHDFL
jgi:hypothetical protein